MQNHDKKRMECGLLISRHVKFLLLTALAGMLWSAGGCDSGPAIVPKTFGNYKDPNNFFSIQYPDSWDASTASSAESKKGYAKYTSGDAEIHVTVCPVMELIGKMAQTGHVVAVGPGTDRAAAAKTVHWLEKPDEKELGIKEQRTLPVETKAGRGNWSEFTTTSETPEHGYRATVVIGDNRIQIICQCPESEWQALKPAFDQVIKSVGE
jgi:hypothetical protein